MKDYSNHKTQRYETGANYGTPQVLVFKVMNTTWDTAWEIFDHTVWMKDESRNLAYEFKISTFNLHVFGEEVHKAYLENKGTRQLLLTEEAEIES